MSDGEKSSTLVSMSGTRDSRDRDLLIPVADVDHNAVDDDEHDSKPSSSASHSSGREVTTLDFFLTFHYSFSQMSHDLLLVLVQFY